MKTPEIITWIASSQFDWGTYYKKGKEELKKALESDPEMWQRWTTSNKRYMLVTYIGLPANAPAPEGPIAVVYNYFDTHISSDSIETLQNAWNYFSSKLYYDSTRQHFIADIKERKIVEFVSVCM